MFDFLKKLFGPKEKVVFTGVLEDDRSPEAKASDIKFEEVAGAAAAVNWKPLDINKLPDWPLMNQNGSSGCVAFTKALMSSILYFARTGVFLPFSPKWIYNFRLNKNLEGMAGYNVFDIESTIGLIPEAMLPSENLSEADLNKFNAEPWQKEVAKALRMSDQKVVLPIQDIETVASVMQVTGKPIMVWFRFAYDEWVAEPLILGSSLPNHHSVTFVPPRLAGQNSYGVYKGEKCIVIQDSWLITPSHNGKRIISKNFFNARNSFAAYSMRFKFDEGAVPKPSYDGTTIVSLQRCLQHNGCFPMNIAFAENMGPVTIKSIKQFQLKYGIEQTGTVGPITKAKLLELYP